MEREREGGREREISPILLEIKDFRFRSYFLVEHPTLNPLRLDAFHWSGMDLDEDGKICFSEFIDPQRQQRW